MSDLLFLCHRIPYPPDKGEKIRAWNLLRGLAGRYRIHLGAFVDDPEDWSGREALEQVCAEVKLLPLDRRIGKIRALAAIPLGQSLSVAFYRDRRMQLWVDERLAEGMDGVFAYASTMAQYVAREAPSPLGASSVGAVADCSMQASVGAVSDRDSAPSALPGIPGCTAFRAVSRSETAPTDPPPHLGAQPGCANPPDVEPNLSRSEAELPRESGAPRRIPTFIADFVDVDSEKWRQYGAAGSVMGGLYRLEGRRLAAFERERAAQADHTLLVSGAERECFLRMAPELADRVHAVPNGVDTEFFSPGQPHEDPFDGVPTLVFTGAMDYRPNVEAVTTFAREVFPGIRAQRPDVRFCIVGLRPAPAVQALAKQEGITVTGRVPDVRPYVANAAAVVAPLTIARGVQNKVLEAMAMGRPVVCTPQALEGIAAKPGAHVLVANGREPLVEAVLALLQRPERARTLGEAAAAFVREHHGWPASVAMVEALLVLEEANEATETLNPPVGGAPPRRISESPDKIRGEGAAPTGMDAAAEAPIPPVGGAPSRRAPAPVPGAGAGWGAGLPDPEEASTLATGRSSR